MEALSRRTFLKSAGGMAIAAVAGGNLVLTLPRRSWAYELKKLSGTQADALLHMTRRLFPSTKLGEVVYAGAVQALDESAAGDAAAAQQLTAGLSDLDARAGGSFAQASPAEQTAILHQIETTPFFKTVRGTAVFVIYNNPDAWAKIGYEGEAYSKGGYLTRGFNDIDWLPR
jgi:Gluconate 2-dehydrogenase subunit 3